MSRSVPTARIGPARRLAPTARIGTARRLVVLAPLAVAVISSGCGSTPLSLTQLRTQATRICLGGSEQTAQIPAPRTPQAGAAFLRRGATVLRPELAQLRTLKPSGQAAADYSSALNAFSRELADVTSAARTYSRQSDPAAALQTLQRHLAPLEVRANHAWRTLQIPACVSR